MCLDGLGGRGRELGYGGGVAGEEVCLVIWQSESRASVGI